MKNTSSIPLFCKTIEAIKYFFLALLATAFLMELSSSLHWRLVNDSAFLHYVAYLINEHGFVPYRDIFEFNMPGTYLFHMAVGKIFGYSDLAFRLVDITWLTATLIVTWFLMKPVGRVVASASCLLFGLIYLGLGPVFSLQREFVAILPIAIGLLLTIQRGPNHSIHLVSFLLGVLFAFAALIKPQLAIGLPIMIIYNCIYDINGPMKSVKTLIKACVIGGIFALSGFLLTLMPPFLWLWNIDALQSFGELYSSYVPLYARISGDYELRRTFFHHITELLHISKDFGGFGMLLTASIFGVYLVLTHSQSTSIKKFSILILLLSILYSFYVLIGGKVWNYHWLPFIYFVSLGAAIVLFSPVLSTNLHRLTILPLFVFILTVTASIPVPDFVRPLLQGIERPVAPMHKRVDEIAAYLNEHLTPTDKVQPLDWITGGIHAMLAAKAVIATPYVTDFQFYHHISNPYIQHLRHDFIKKLKAEMPKFIIDIHAEFDPIIKPRISGLDTTQQFLELEEFIKKNYKKDYRGAGFDIFRKK